MNIQLKAWHYQLRFRHSFHIAHGSRNFTDTVYTSVSDGNFTGYGEAALPPYLGYDATKVVNEIQSFQFIGDDFVTILNNLHASGFSRPAKASLDIALHDLWSRKESKSLHELLGLPLKEESICFYTLGISSIAELDEKLSASKETKVYKIKLGGENDHVFLKEFRKRSDIPFCADANQAWKNVDKADEHIRMLKDLDCIFIEQPMPVDHPDADKLFQKSLLPVYLDESVQHAEDIRRNADFCHGINIKLVKCGGILPAMEWIKTAKDSGLKILSGCMSESSCGAAGALQVSGLSEYTDLDGPLLISNDPFNGLRYNAGMIAVKEKTGTGVFPA